MTADLEFTGRNVRKAVQQAAKKLQIPIEDIRYDILSHGSTGIFGLAGVKKARIRLRNHHGGATPAEQSTDNERVAPVSVDDDGGDSNDQQSQHMEEALSIGKDVLRRMVEAISPEATIEVQQKDREWRLVIQGGQAGVLIGKRGQTLEAMQLIVEKAVRRVNGHDFRLQVDVEDYLAKKQAGLVQTAQRLAQKAVAKNNPASLGYLNAHDRRVVHIAMKDRRDVRTKSVGEGPIRKLMIYPRQKSKPKS